jgi:hypothetical protein
MTNNVWLTGLALLVAGGAGAQTPDAPPAFDVASVKEARKNNFTATDVAYPLSLRRRD